MSVILGIDPGTKNFAVSRTKNGSVVQVSMIGSTLLDLKANQLQQLKAFAGEMAPWLRGCDVVRAERYTNRGVRSVSNELINIMLGYLYGGADVELIMPAIWKNRCNKFFDLNCYYKCVATPPHVVDATLIALYPNFDFALTDLRDL